MRAEAKLTVLAVVCQEVAAELRSPRAIIDEHGRIRPDQLVALADRLDAAAGGEA
jgi:hypothetical protein